MLNRNDNIPVYMLSRKQRVISLAGSW